MSGGSYDYAYLKIQEVAETLRHQERDPRRAAFAKLLRLVSEAMHDIEWVDSCDRAEGGDHKAIDAVFAFLQADPATIAKARSFDELAGILRKFWQP